MVVIVKNPTRRMSSTRKFVYAAYRGNVGARGQRPVREVTNGKVGRIVDVRTTPRGQNYRADKPTSRMSLVSSRHGSGRRPGLPSNRRSDIPLSSSGFMGVFDKKLAKHCFGQYCDY